MLEADETVIEGGERKRVFTAKNISASTGSLANQIIAAVVLIVLFTYLAFRSYTPVPDDGTSTRVLLPSETGVNNFSTDQPLHVVSWNIAAINNNPFEYWITYDDPAYNQLMDEVSKFVDSPGAADVLVSQIFTPTMFEDLKGKMLEMGWDPIAIEKTTEYWEKDYQHRHIVSEFVKDDLLGLKRLISMPDRMTNTININDGKQIFRPTVHNCYNGDLGSTIPEWWKLWKTFMFDEEVVFAGSSETQVPAEKLTAIKRSKYPALTEEEEKISIPLQTVLAAVFDAILVNMVNSVAKDWQDVRHKLCNALNLRKNDRILEILEQTYAPNTNIVFLQEVASAFVDRARASPGLNDFAVLTSDQLNTKRDQNSVMLLRKDTFDVASVLERTAEVEAVLKLQNEGKSVPVAQGDIFAITVQDVARQKYLLASFHGDTNGLATIPVVRAVHGALAKLNADDKSGETRLLFGLDANTYEHATPGKQQDVLEFATAYNSMGLTSCWGDTPDPTNHTTFNARTFLQTQLNKASRRDEMALKGDINPKDFILFRKGDFEVSSTTKDNTGERRYVENMVFPTLAFPSDHGALATVLRPSH